MTVCVCDSVHMTVRVTVCVTVCVCMGALDSEYLNERQKRMNEVAEKLLNATKFFETSPNHQ